MVDDIKKTLWAAADELRVNMDAAISGANMDIIKGHANGSTFMEISKKAFRPIPIVVPSPGILGSFTQIAGSLFNRISINTEQADALSSLRDTLLPRLISGQLRLPETQAIVEEYTT